MRPANQGRSPTMQQAADWLEKLGLGQYAQRFAENDISFSVLPDLTDQHCKEIGVSLGHRLQLLRAIAKLADAEKPPKPSSDCTLCRSTGHCRASSSHRDVFGLGRLDSIDAAQGAVCRSDYRHRLGVYDVANPPF